jgi:hypothetical protein
MIKVTLKGSSEIQARLKSLVEQHQRAAAAALYQEGLKIMAASVERTPVDTGALRQSANVSPPEGSGSKIHVELTYGKDYAAAVHEKTEVHHEVGQAKFLESALSDAAGDFQKNLAERIEANVKSGTGMGTI